MKGWRYSSVAQAPVWQGWGFKLNPWYKKIVQEKKKKKNAKTKQNKKNGTEGWGV